MNEPTQDPPQAQSEESAGIDIELRLAPGDRVQIVIETLPGCPPAVYQESFPAASRAPALAAPTAPAHAPVSAAPRLKAARLRLPDIRVKAASAQLLFGAALAVYLLTRLIAITQYPAYFFCDEAVNTVLAADFIRDGFHSTDRELLPTFFKNGGQYNLSTSVYLQVIPYLMFGKSVAVTRGVVALMSVLAALWIAWILRDHFKTELWWLAPLALAAIPTWFLHSRAAFENALLVTFYAGFLYYYLNYRGGKPQHLYPALVLGALAFYTYTPGQIVVVATGLALLVVDFRHHLQNRQVALRGLGLLAALALPLARFWLIHPQEYANRLSMYGSYWMSDTGLVQKIGQYLGKYAAGFNPIFWFVPDRPGEVIHQMAGHAHVPLLFLPFFAWGLWLAVKRLRQPEMRTTLLALLAAPAGAALVALTVNRALVMVIPVVLLSVIGMAAAVEQVVKRARVPAAALAYGLLAVLFVASTGLLYDGLYKEPLRHTNYGLGGLQYGAKEVFGLALDHRAAHPDEQVIVSPNWTFQSEVVRQFFVVDDGDIRMQGIDDTIQVVDPDIGRKVFILMLEEYRKVVNSGHFDEPEVLRTIPYPDGSPGFYLARLRYRDDIQAVMQAEKELRGRLVESSAQVSGEAILVRHPKLDGDLQNLFDGNLDSLVKTMSVNPLVIELVYDAPHYLSGVSARVGSESVRVTVQVWEQGEEPTQTYIREAAEGTEPYKEVRVDFEAPREVTRLRFELQDVNASDESIVHLWELLPIPAP